MPRQPNEKTLGNIDGGLSDRIDAAIARRNDMKKKQFNTAALEFFLSLPDEVIDTLLVRPPGSEVFNRLSDACAKAWHTDWRTQAVILFEALEKDSGIATRFGATAKRDLMAALEQVLPRELAKGEVSPAKPRGRKRPSKGG